MPDSTQKNDKKNDTMSNGGQPILPENIQASTDTVRGDSPSTDKSSPPVGRDFDHANYRRDLETLLKYAYDEYKHIGLERQRSQLTYIRHYLWIAALIIGTSTSFFWFLKNPIQDIKWLSQEPGLLFYLASFVTVISSLTVLALAIDALRGRDMTHLPFGKFMDHAENAYECALEGAYRPMMLTTLINNIDAANAAHIPKIHIVGIKLRWMSRLLLASLCSGVIAALSRITIHIT